MAAVHATAVSIAGEALLIRGASRAGKSRLAFALIARSTPYRPIVLVGDDRIVLRETPDGLVAAPHPRIAGFIERRGLGLVAMPWSPAAPVAGAVCIGATAPEPRLAGLPSLEIAAPCDIGASLSHVLAWWGHSAAARATHRRRNAPADIRSRAKDWNW